MNTSASTRTLLRLAATAAFAVAAALAWLATGNVLADIAGCFGVGLALLALSIA